MRSNMKSNEFVPRPDMKFTKTETEYNFKSIRFLLLTITTMFILIGALMIVLGISVYAHYHSFFYFYESAKSGSFFTPSIMSVIIGIALVVISSFGFFGSLKQSTCMVNTYAFILTIILLVKMVAVIIAFTMNVDTVAGYIEIPVWQYIEDLEIRDEIDTLQVSLNCCGSDSYMDYSGMNFTSNHSTIVYYKTTDTELVPVVLPQSCCLSTGDVMCARVRSLGCREALGVLIVQNSSVLGVLGVSVMFIQLLGVIFALLLARCIRKMKSERALIVWKTKEQTILALQNNGSQPQKEPAVYIQHPESSVA